MPFKGQVCANTRFVKSDFLTTLAWLRYMKNGNHIRIKDIAEKAGCSIGTVDRVIHNRGKVSEPVKQRILKIIKEIDYKPNVNARVLASKRPLILGSCCLRTKRANTGNYRHLGINEALRKV